MIDRSNAEQNVHDHHRGEITAQIQFPIGNRVMGNRVGTTMTKLEVRVFQNI